MRNNLWEGVFFRMLASVCVGFPSSVSTLIFLQFAILYDPNQHRFGTLSTLATATKIKFKKRASQSGTWAHIQLIPDNFIALLGVWPNSGFTHESKTTDARAECISIWVPKQYLPPMVVSYLPGELASMPWSLPEHTMQPSESPPPLTDPSVKDFQINSSSGTSYLQVNHQPGIQDLHKSSKQTCPTSMPHHQEVSQSSAAVKPLNTSQSRVLRALDIINLTGPDPDCDPDLCMCNRLHSPQMEAQYGISKPRWGHWNKWLTLITVDSIKCIACILYFKTEKCLQWDTWMLSFPVLEEFQQSGSSPRQILGSCKFSDDHSWFERSTRAINISQPTATQCIIEPCFMDIKGSEEHIFFYLGLLIGNQWIGSVDYFRYLTYQDRVLHIVVNLMEIQSEFPNSHNIRVLNNAVVWPNEKQIPWIGWCLLL